MNCQAFWFSVAFATKGGVATLIETLKNLEAKGVPGQVLVSQYQNFTEPEALKMLLKFSNVGLRMMTRGNFHAKGYMFKTAFGRNLIVGSSNLTDNALCSNKEWNLKISALAESEIMFQSHAEFEKEYQEAVEVDTDFNNGTLGATLNISDSDLVACKPICSLNWGGAPITLNGNEINDFTSDSSNNDPGQLPVLLKASEGSTSVYFTAIDRDGGDTFVDGDLTFTFSIEYLG